jgi:hypothetical protein
MTMLYRVKHLVKVFITGQTNRNVCTYRLHDRVDRSTSNSVKYDMIVAENFSNMWNRGWFSALGLQVDYYSISLVFRLRNCNFSISRWVAYAKDDVRKPGTDIILVTRRGCYC